MSEQGLTLFEIDSSLLQLIEARAELQAAIAGPPLGPAEDQERREELAEVERLLVEYQAQLPAKVDRVRGLLLHAKNAAEVHRAEAARQEALARQWERVEADVKEMAATVISAVPERKRLPGSRGYLLLKGNGGLKPLVVTDAGAVPEELCRYVGWVSGTMHAKLEAEFPHFWEFWSLNHKLDRVVDNEAVRAAIIKDGGVPGAHLGERGSHVEVK